MGSPTRKDLEQQPTWVGTFEFSNNPGAYRVLMQAPIGESLYWQDIHRNGLPWQWGISSVYEGDSFLEQMINEDTFKLVSGRLPWDKTVSSEIDHAKVLAVARQMLGLD